MDNYKTLSFEGVKYQYLHIPPCPSANGPTKPYLLFLHGAPSTSHDWRHQVSYFSSLGYGIVAPDLLGYGGTEKPLNLASYRKRKIAGEVVGILDHEGIKQVIGIGHDWGCVLLSRLLNYHPPRLSAVVFMAVMYVPPGGHFDLDKVNEAFKAGLGYDAYGYWNFFNQPDASELLQENADSTWSIFFPADPNLWKTHLAPTGALREWLTTKSTAPEASYVTQADKETHQKLFSRENGGYGPMLNWYRSTIANVDEEDEKSLPPEATTINVPIMLATAKKDVLSLGEHGVQETRKHLASEGLLTVQQFDTGHWMQLEAKEEINSALEQFVKERVEK